MYRPKGIVVNTRSHRFTTDVIYAIIKIRFKKLCVTRIKNKNYKEFDVFRYKV